MKITPQEKKTILDVAAVIAGTQMDGTILKSNSDEVRVLLQATRLVRRLPDVLEAVEGNPELLHGDHADVIEIAVDHVKAVTMERLRDLDKEREDAVVEESQKTTPTDDVYGDDDDDKGGDDSK